MATTQNQIGNHLGNNLGNQNWMSISMLKCKIHRAKVTDADLNYEGSISIDPLLIEAAGLFLHERVDIYNINNGARFSTYVIKGKPGEICLNGAAARHVQRDDLVIICSYCTVPVERAASYVPRVVFVDNQNRLLPQNQPEAQTETIAHQSAPTAPSAH